MLGTKLLMAANKGVTSLAYDSYSAEGNASASTTFTCPYPSGISEGDLLLAVCFFDGSETITSATQPTGFTHIGAEATQGTAGEYPDPIIGYRIADGTESGSITWPDAEVGSEPYTGIIILFKPDAPLTAVTINDYAAENGPSAVTVTVGTSASTAPALGLAVCCGRPTAQTPTLTDADADATVTVSGTGLTTGNATIGYKLFAKGDATSDRSASTNDAGRQCLLTCALSFE